MSRIRTTIAPAVVGLLAAAGVAAPALAAGVRDDGGAGFEMPGLSQPAMPGMAQLPEFPSLIPGQGQDKDGSSLQCMMFAYNLGPFGPLGPWGPMGPLHDKPHPACWGGGPQSR